MQMPKSFQHALPQQTSVLLKNINPNRVCVLSNRHILGLGSWDGPVNQVQSCDSSNDVPGPSNDQFLE